MLKLWNRIRRNAALLIIITFLSIILEGCSLLGIRTTNEAVYTVEKKVGDIEIRHYERAMTIETYTDKADFRDATGQSFRLLFDYISGANISANDIAMTAPVIAEPREGKDTKLSLIHISEPTRPY